MKDTQPTTKTLIRMARCWSWAPGLQDTLHLGRGRLVKGDGPLVQRAVAMPQNLDLPMASAADAEAT